MTLRHELYLIYFMYDFINRLAFGQLWALPPEPHFGVLPQSRLIDDGSAYSITENGAFATLVGSFVK